MPNSRVILLEFNELTPALLDDFFAKGKLPNFKRFYDESLVYVTDAEIEPPRLDPWVQWVTVHTGLTADEHGLTNLDQGHQLDTPRVWDLASRAGKKALICGSMNIGHDDDLNGWVVPDPWSTAVAPYPAGEGIEDFYRFVQTQVQEHTNDSVPLGSSDYAKFLKFMVKHGLSAATTSAIISQLGKERLAGQGRWKRAFILDKLQFDVFRAIYKKIQPDFSTFFLNSTAHMQHVYWRHMDPEPFKVKPGDEDREEYGDAVLAGYEEMDALLARIMNMAGDDVTLVFATALGQQPCLVYEDMGGKGFYRPRNFADFTSAIGVQGKHTCSPVMSEEFRIRFEDEAAADAGIARLEALRMGDRELVKIRREDARTVFTGCSIFDAVPEGSMVTGADGLNVPFYDILYAADTLKSGMHHPDGALWIRTPGREHRVHDGKVSLTQVAPSLVSLMGLEIPEYMRAPLDSVVEATAPVS